MTQATQEQKQQEALFKSADRQAHVGTDEILAELDRDARLFVLTMAALGAWLTWLLFI